MVQAPCGDVSHISSIYHVDRTPRYDSPQRHRKLVGEFYQPSGLEHQQGLWRGSSLISIAYVCDEKKGNNEKEKVILRSSYAIDIPKVALHHDRTSIWEPLLDFLDWPCNRVECMGLFS